MKNNNKILVLGSGALTIGQAGEFDYSGTQCLLSLEEEGYFPILVNPNIATVQTNPSDKRKVYLHPVTPDYVEKIIEKERPFAIVGGFAGQTGLNCLIELEKRGVLKKYNIKNFGTKISTLELTENREQFAKKMREIGVPMAPSITATTIEEALEKMDDLGYPVVIRSAFSLGGLGGGFANNESELKKIVVEALSKSPQVLIEKSLLGWKEIEYEVMRDSFGNKITICNMENLDPLGVHTGDSMVFAPSQTIDNVEYQLLRTEALKIVEELEIIGECNVQYALDPFSRQFYVIEINARLSRSSALASKASGYPIAFIAAKVVAGKRLSEIKNPIVKGSTAFFEPAFDYVAMKIPRWDLNKFENTNNQLGPAMKSVGEIMSIGKSIEEALLKGVRMVSESELGHLEFVYDDTPTPKLLDAIKAPSTERLFFIFELLRRGTSVKEIHALTFIDHFYLEIMKKIVLVENDIREKSEADFNSDTLRLIKKVGFSDKQIEQVSRDKNLDIRKLRQNLGIYPVFKRIDTSAAEFPAETNYYYSTYHGQYCELEEIQDNFVLILGGGSYRIGSSVEFDWCIVESSKELRKQGRKTAILNFNPETVSTDYHSSDVLIFDEIGLERVLDIKQKINVVEVLSCMGGQVPNNIAEGCETSGLQLLGHNATTINNCENRKRFSALLDEIQIDQAQWISTNSQDEIKQFVEKVKFPILVRPSFVLSGAAIKVVHNEEELKKAYKSAQKASPNQPIVLTKFHEGYRELEIDGVAKNGEVVCRFLSEHIENAGVHSGDATVVFPPQKTYLETAKRVYEATKKIAQKINLNGPFNIQFLAKDNSIMVIELNARASRSFPFISKVSGVNLASLSIQAATNTLPELTQESSFDYNELPEFVGVKSAMFSFNRLGGVDPVLSVEMSATGEVGCISQNYRESLRLSLEAVGYRPPTKGVLLSTGNASAKSKFFDLLELFSELEVPLYATAGTHEWFKREGLDTKLALWPGDKSGENVIDLIHNKKVDLVINIPKNGDPEEIENDYLIRLNAVTYGSMLITEANLANQYFRTIWSDSNELTYLEKFSK